VVDPGGAVVDLVERHAEQRAEVVHGPEDGVAEPDDVEVRGDRGQVGDVHRHRVGVVEQPGVRADRAHVRRDALQHRKRAQRPEDPADADGVADGLPQPVPGGHLEVPDGRGVHAHLDGVDDVVGAVQRGPPVEAGGDLRGGAELLGGTAGDRLGRLQPLRVDVVQGERRLFELIEGQEVGEELPGEDHTAGTEERDHSHGSDCRQAAQKCARFFDLSSANELP
jgi:hypothetical protein